MSRIIRFTSQKTILKYLNEEYMIQDYQMSRGERKIMDKLVSNGKVKETHCNIGLWSSAGKSWIEYRLTELVQVKSDSDGLYSFEDYNKD